MKNIKTMDIIKIKSLHNMTISYKQFEELLLNENVDYIELWKGYNYIVNTIDGDDFEIYLIED